VEFNFLLGGFMAEIKKKDAIGYPFPPMLIIFPIVLYTTTFISLITYQIYDKVFWFRLAYTANMTGVLLSLVALLPAIMALRSEPLQHVYARKEEFFHISLSILALILFSVNLWLQADQWELNYPVVGSSTLLTGIGLASAYMAGFFGWDLIQKYFVRSKSLEI
jgi:uncharacterized membrane protein